MRDRVISKFYHSFLLTKVNYTRLHYSEWCCRCLSHIRTLYVRCPWLVHSSPLTAECWTQQDRGDLVCPQCWSRSSGGHRRHQTVCNTHWDQATVHPSDCVRDLGVLLDSSLSIRQHIAKITSSSSSSLSFVVRRYTYKNIIRSTAHNKV